MTIAPAILAETVDATLHGARRVRFTATLRSPIGIAAILGLSVLLLVAIVGPFIFGAQAVAGDVTQLSAKPSPDHLFGTDAGGRDVLARVVTATRVSVLMALAATAIGVVLGVVVGFLPTILPRAAARFVVSATGIALAFPALLLTIVFSIIVGTGVVGAILAIGLAMVPLYGRLSQTLAASVAGRDFVSAARVLGVSRVRILARHILPNVQDPLIVNASIGAGSALVAFAGLSFLGLGVQAPDFDWGRLLNEGISKIYVNPATALAPGSAIVLSGVVFTLVGEALARAFGMDSLISRRPRTPIGPIQVQIPSSLHSDFVLSVRDLSVAVPVGDGWRYPVDGVSFDVRRGEIVGIVGESGSGKSLTCMAVAALLEDPLVVRAGTLTFDGIDLTAAGIIPSRVRRAANARRLGTRMAFVFQDPSTSLNPAIHVGSQVAEASQIHEGLSVRQAAARSIQKLRAVRIPEPERRARQYPHEFSGGMRQRAMIAAGLMGEPALIIADEPTTALDVTVQGEVLALLRAVNEDDGAAIILVSHDIAVVASVCSRVLVMYRGRVVEEIGVKDLVRGRARHPYTRALVEAVPDLGGTPGTPFATIPEGTVFPRQSADVLEEAASNEQA